MTLYNKKIAVGLILFLLCTIFATGIVTYINIKKKKDTSQAFFQEKEFPDSNADMTMDNFHFTQTGKDKIDWEVKAAKARLFKKDKVAVLEDIEATFTTPQGVRLELRGDEGIFNTESRDIYIRKKNNDVRIVSNNGYKMSANSLSWQNNNKVAITNDAVLIEGPQLKIKGKGFRFNVLSQELEIIADVEANIKY
ncbi:MAG: LPS export ABC transporter periplasmic protein LptC [Nitrospirae bacterium]|nr:LPS export ABC transporter periplasmic protein LptC [Nitrospirota bacterium]